MKTAGLLALMLVGCQQSAPPAATSEASPSPKSEAVEYDAAKATEMAAKAKPKEFWWPKQINLQPLRDHGRISNPHEDFDYARAFAAVDFPQLKKDVEAVLTDSKDWWPADYGNYGPFFIRLSWHAAGTYRVRDGRGGSGGGQQRFEPLNSWPDNTNLDKARRLLWPVKQKYGRSVSWADLLVLAGNVAMENMGFQTYGFAGGREDDWEADLVYWGPETEMLADERYEGDRALHNPLAAVQMGLIYVNPEGPNGNSDPLASAKDIRTTFGRMAMNDEETVALIAGGHTFGKVHGAVKADCLGPEPAGAAVEDQSLGWKNKCGKGKAEDTVTSGLEGAWTSSPAQWTHQYLSNLFAFEWVKTTSPAGATQWKPSKEGTEKLVPDAHRADVRHPPMMLTSDLALRMDPDYEKVSKRFLENPKEFELAFAKAWYKLIHRDLGPLARYVPGELPKEPMIWQDPIPDVDHPLANLGDQERLKGRILASGLSVSELVRAAWASASSFRSSDMRGGANGARVRLAPQKDWAVNDPAELAKVLTKLTEIQKGFNAKAKGKKKVSLADLIVLGGNAAVEKAAKDAGVNIKVPFKVGRMDAGQEMTDVESFAALEPKADPFRNYFVGGYETGYLNEPSAAMVDKADHLTLSVPEMTVLVGGMRALNANAGGAKHGVFTDAPGTLSNDFFVNLLDMSTEWKAKDGEKGVFEGTDRDTGKVKWTATEVDLVFGSNAELRAVAEVYAFEGAQKKFVRDFVAAWTKVMNLDRFEPV
ncbi:MAG: catalase/peroxidase HPI [Myxococcota bacterium]